MATDQNGKTVTKNVRSEADGTWSANVWSGSAVATNVRRNTGYLTRQAAQQADISETVEQTNQRVCGRK
jgi:hypothetical protein